MQYFIFFFMALKGVVFKKSRLLFFTIFILMWVLYGWNLGNADYLGYEIIYNSMRDPKAVQYFSESFELGYLYLNKLFFDLGFSYSSFLKIISLVCLGLISNTILKFSLRPGYVMALYLIYPFLIDIVQVRNFIVMSLIIFGIRYLTTSSKQDIIKYILLVLVASLFHISAFFYLILVLAKIKNRRNLVKLTGTIFIMLSLVLILDSFGFSFFGLANLGYLNIYTSFYTRIGYLLYFVFSFYLVKFAYTKVEKSESRIDQDDFNNHQTLNEDNSELNFADIILNINIILMIVYPLLFSSAEFIRFYRSLLPLNYILFSNVSTKTNGKVNMILYKLISLLFVIISGWVFIYILNMDSVFYPIFEENSIIIK